MWVRSQNKEILTEVTSIRLRKYTDPKIDIIAEKEDSMHLVATYTTQEQALEVLNQIQERINEGCPYVYEMPSEEQIPLIKNVYDELDLLYKEGEIDEEMVFNWAITSFISKKFNPTKIQSIFNTVLMEILEKEEE